jgi:hypothetical protein
LPCGSYGGAPKDTKSNGGAPNVIKNVNKEARIKRRLLKEGIQDYLKVPTKKK